MWFEWPYTDLHSLNLDWILNLIKMWQGQWKQLPEYIKEQIEKYLEDANLAEIVQNVLKEYGFVINVKVPGNELTPALGDGSTDDTEAIQAMIAYGSEHGMPLLFPAGTYRVSGLNVNVDTVFMGSASVLMLMNGSSSPLISISASFECFGMTLNGNIGGQTEPQTVVLCNYGKFMINNCRITSGVSGISGNVTEECRLVDSEISNFTEYGLYIEGSGHLVSTAVTIPNVASGGALRFIRLDASNNYITAWYSLSEVAVGVEIMGDNNYIIANFPNVESPVNDRGQNNNWEIVGKSEKHFFNGTAYHDYENLQETVTGDKTENIGDKTETITNKTENVQEYSQTVNNFKGMATEKYTFSGQDIELNPTNPLTYKTPESLNEYFDFIKMKDKAGNVYNVLVAGTGLDELGRGNNYVNVKDYGAAGDGVTDDINAINLAKAEAVSKKIPLYFPEGEYLISTSIIGWDNMSLIGANKYTSIIRIEENVYEPCVNFNNTPEKTVWNNIVVRNLCFDGNKQNVSNPTLNSHAFRLLGFTNLVIDYCRFINAGGYGLGLQGRPDNVNPAYTGKQQYCFINGCDFNNNGLSSEAAGNSDGCDIKLVRYLFMSNCVAWNNSDGGIDIRAERAVLNNIVSRINGTVGVHVRTPSYCELNNIFTESNGLSGITLFAGSGYSGYSNQFLCKVNGAFLSGDTTALAIAYEGEESYPIYIDIGNIYCINAKTGISVNNVVPTHYITIHDCSLIGNNKSGSIGIDNDCSNVQLTNIYINRFTTGYNGGKNSTESTINLQNNRATTAISGTEPEINYPIFPKTE